MTGDYRHLSLWLDDHPGPLEPRAPLGGDTPADVAIVGGGYTGLWTAYYLLRLDPALRVLVIEKEIVGFGASGRNGGWCVGDLAAGPDRQEKVAGNRRRSPAAQVSCSTPWTRWGGSHKERASTAASPRAAPIRLARNPAQMARQREEVAHWQRAFGLTDDDLHLLDAREARNHLNASERGGWLLLRSHRRAAPGTTRPRLG